MTRLARRASLLVAFYLLTSTATAYAECAWVLWGMMPRMGGGLDYMALHASASEKACKEELMERKSRAKESGGAAPLLCLPDTVDPRGPKGR